MTTNVMTLRSKYADSLVRIQVRGLTLGEKSAVGIRETTSASG
jgi:hypothetical protein